MNFTSQDIDKRLQFFSEIISCSANCYLWTYEADGTLLSTNCPYLVLDRVFRRSTCFESMMAHAASGSAPMLLSNEYDLVWGAVFERTGEQLDRIHVLGPAWTQTMNTAHMERSIAGKVTTRWKPTYMHIMSTLPVINIVMFVQHVITMQYCVTNERIENSDVVMQRSTKPAQKPAAEPSTPGVYTDRIQIYMAEKKLLDMIRNGDINYQEIRSTVSGVFTGRHQFSNDPLQHSKLGQAQFMALCCAAAIEGGLSPETAYNRKDAYIQAVESAKSISEITEISMKMYADYVQLVHRQRVNPQYSRAVQSACDFIENHLSDNLSAETLASRVGYSSYYFSRLFKKETGYSIDEYARYVRIERAKTLLAGSSDSIQDIAAALGFGGRNYFAVVFKQVTGMPPAAYRKKHQNL